MIEVNNKFIHYFVNEQNQYHGEFKEWYRNGQLHCQCFYNNGKLHGEYKDWHDNGQLWEHCFYVNGKENGECKCWNTDGKLYVHCFVVDGKYIDFNEIPYPSTPEERMMFMLKYDLPLLPVEE